MGGGEDKTFLFIVCLYANNWLSYCFFLLKKNMYCFNEDIHCSICRGEHDNIVRIALSSEQLVLTKILNKFN